jgi:hypothetical protein
LFPCRHCRQAGRCMHLFCDDEKIQIKWILIVACSFEFYTENI